MESVEEIEETGAFSQHYGFRQLWIEIQDRYGFKKILYGLTQDDIISILLFALGA